MADNAPKTGSGMDIGLYSFGELIGNPLTGIPVSAQQRLQEMLAAARLADELGLDVFGVGEHHRLDFAVSAPPVVLGAMAQVTQRVRLASAVTILSTADPVRVFEDFATVDLLSQGRAELIVGRGAFVESFPLFGYDLNDYEALFPEKLDLLMKLNNSQRITWQGRFRSALEKAEIAPRPLQPQLPIWVGVGGTPQSATRAGTLGLPMSLAIIGGASARFAPLVDLYRQSGLRAGHAPEQLQVGVNSHFHIHRNSQQAVDEFYPYYSHYLTTISGGRFRVSPGDYAQLAALEGGLFVGSPQQIIDKLLYQQRLFGHQRFLAQLDIGGMPYGRVAEAIELLATEVAPVVRRETSSGAAG